MGETKRLLLLRHAKSSWDDPSLADHDRPLAPRGRKAAKLIGEYLRSERIEISLVLCSSARRAGETLVRAQPLGEAAIVIEPGLYGASRSELLDRVHHLSDDIDSAMVIGHNPALEDLTLALAQPGTELAGGKFPTGALATLTFSGRWHDLAPGKATLTGFVKPRELR
jgi:phosphohistidine phosphatase